MNRFPDKNSVLILDNASLHHGGRVARLCEDQGVLLIYLPPYSPDMNPIEKVFSVLKSQLKRRQILTGTAEDADIIKHVLPEIVTPELMASLFRGSNYAA
jgi:transposase